MIHIPAHTVLQRLHHLVIHAGACPAKCSDVSTVSFPSFCVCVIALHNTPENFLNHCQPSRFLTSPLASFLSHHMWDTLHSFTGHQQLVKCNLESTALEIQVPSIPHPHLLLQPQQVIPRRRNGPHGACVQPLVGRAGRPGQGSVCRLPTALSAAALSGSRDSATTLLCAQVG